MSHRHSLRLLALAAALAAGPLALAQTTTLLDEDFSDLERSTLDLPNSSPWVTISPSSTLSALSGSLVQTVTTSNRSFYTYFTPDTAPRSLAIGDSLTVSFTFTINGTVGTNNDALRLGLLDSFGTTADLNAATTATRNLADGIGIGSSPMPDASGYFFSLNAAPTGSAAINLWQRGTGSPGILNTGYATQVGATGGSDLNFVGALPYTATFTVTRTGADRTAISLAFDGTFADSTGALITATQGLALTDDSGAVYTFDTFGVFAGTNFATSLAIDDFKIDFNGASAVPEPSTLALLSAALLALPFLRRPREE